MQFEIDWTGEKVKQHQNKSFNFTFEETFVRRLL